METKNNVLDHKFSHLVGEIIYFNEDLNIIPFYFIQEIKDPDGGMFIPKTMEVTQIVTNTTWTSEACKRIYPKLGCFIQKPMPANTISNSINHRSFNKWDLEIDQDTNLLFLGAHETFSFHVPFTYKVKTEKGIKHAEYEIPNNKEHNLGGFKNDFYSSQKNSSLNKKSEILEDDIAFENFGTIYDSIGFVFLHPDLKLVLVPLEKNLINNNTLISKKHK